jgi:2-oxoglutarate ferredoxin oxidoreductase subunit delta
MDDVFNRQGFCAARVDDMAECTGCALCAEVCPEIAIEVWRETARDRA